FGRFVDREAAWHVAGERVVSSRLVGNEIESLAAPGEFRYDVGGVAEQPDGQRPTLRGRGAHTPESVLERLGCLVQVSRLQPPFDAGRVDLDTEDRAARQCGSERLRAAHPAEARCENRPAGERRRTEVPLRR